MSAMSSNAILEEDASLLNVEKMTGDMAVLMQETVQAAAAVQAPPEMRTDDRYAANTVSSAPMKLAFGDKQGVEASARLNQAAETLYFAFD